MAPSSNCLTVRPTVARASFARCTRYAENKQSLVTGKARRAEHVATFSCRDALLTSRHVICRRTCCAIRAAQSSGESSTALAPDMTQTKVLFVCLGNICRSPTAEAVFKKVVDRSGVADEFVIDSCGTGGGNEDWYKLNTKDAWAHHEGDPADERMTAAAKKRDIHLTSKSRPLKPEDFTNFDYIIGMDHENSKEIKKAAAHWQDDLKKELPDNWKDKIQLMCTYLTKAEYKELQEVPDPYFGGEEGFEKVLDLLEDACEGLVSHIESSKFATES